MVPMPVPSRSQRALFNEMVRFSIAQIMIFTPSLVLSVISKIIIWAIENLSIPLDRAHQFVLGTTIGTVGRGFWAIAGGITRIGC